MSRIGNKPIEVPAGVEVKIEGSVVSVKGPHGALSQAIDPRILVKMEGATITVSRPNDNKEMRSLHGLSRTLIANMVEGTHKMFQKDLEINGVGYRAAKEGTVLVMNLGYSHQVRMPEIEGITIEVPSPNKISIKGPDKQKVGHFAAEVRGKRPPEPYKGKGIKYAGEVIIRKEGKAGKAKA